MMHPSDFVSIYCELAELVGIENTYKIFEHFAIILDLDTNIWIIILK